MSANLPKIYAKPMLTFWTNWPCSVFELFFFVSCSYFLGPLARNRWKWKVLLWKWKCMYDNETELKTHCHHEWQMSWFIKVYPCQHNTELKLYWVYLVFTKDGGKFGMIIRRPDWSSVDKRHSTKFKQNKYQMVLLLKIRFSWWMVSACSWKALELV